MLSEAKRKKNPMPSYSRKPTSRAKICTAEKDILHIYQVRMTHSPPVLIIITIFTYLNTLKFDPSTFLFWVLLLATAVGSEPEVITSQQKQARH